MEKFSYFLHDRQHKLPMGEFTNATEAMNAFFGDDGWQLFAEFYMVLMVKSLKNGALFAMTWSAVS